ncbi:MAG: hypothetical protein QME12_06985 [Nanoarchaeota archaeon]|nr:hypothetical protein [Nanoarchaeota archaeon]
MRGKKPGGGKRGIVQSIGMMMLAGLLLSLAVLIYHDTQKGNERFSEMMVYDRLYDLDSSISYGFGKILQSNGLSASLQGNSFIISESLPGSSRLVSEIGAFASFISERHASNPLVAFSNSTMDSVKQTVPIIISPHNITISHTSYPSGNLQVVPSSVNINNYTIYIEASKTTVAFNSAGMPSGSLPVSVSVKTLTGTSLWRGNINPAASNTLLLNFDAGLPLPETMTITVNDPAKLVINRGNMSILQTVTIGLQQIGNEQAAASFPASLYSISFENSNLSKTGTVFIQ